MSEQVLTPPPSTGVSLKIWIIALAVILPYFWFFGLLGRMGEHWLPMALIASVGLMISGQFGSGLGLPTLFRDDPDKPPQFFSRSFLSGIGVTLLVIVVWTVVFYSEFLNHSERTYPYEATYAQRLKAGNVLPIINNEGIIIGGWAWVLAWFLIIASAPTLALVALCVAFPTPDITARRESSGRPTARRRAAVT